MRNWLWILLLALQQSSYAQVRAIQHRAPLDSSSIVLDSAGKRLDFSEWKQLVRTGNYDLKSNISATDSQQYVLYRLPRTRPKTPDLLKPVETAYFKTGQKFKYFGADDIFGNKFKPKDLEGRTLVINFWFVKIPSLTSAMAGLNNLMANYKDNENILYFSIALDPAASIVSAVKTIPFKYHLVADGRYLAEKYGVKSFPTTVIVGKEGSVLFHSSGFSSKISSWMKKVIDQDQAPNN